MEARDPMNDMEVARFIAAQPRSLTYPELARRCAERFGAARAWDEDTIRRWRLLCPRPRGLRPVIDRDPEVRAFIMDRIGLDTCDALMTALHAAFPGRTLPSRSGLHRYMQRERARCESRPCAPCWGTV